MPIKIKNSFSVCRPEPGPRVYYIELMDAESGNTYQERVTPRTKLSDLRGRATAMASDFGIRVSTWRIMVRNPETQRNSYLSHPLPTPEPAL